MTRLFVALNIPDEIKKKIVELRRDLVNQIPGNQYEKLRWEPEEKLHLTLKFIGEVEDSIVNKIVDAVDFIKEYEKLNSELTKFGFFYKKKAPKILWIGLKIDSSVYKLTEELNKKMQKFFIPIENREFSAHLTLLRIKNNLDKNFIASFEQFVIPETKFIAEDISLIKSELLPEGSKYTEIKKINLK